MGPAGLRVLVACGLLETSPTRWRHRSGARRHRAAAASWARTGGDPHFSRDSGTPALVPEGVCSLVVGDAVWSTARPLLADPVLGGVRWEYFRDILGRGFPAVGRSRFRDRRRRVNTARMLKRLDCCALVRYWSGKAQRGSSTWKTRARFQSCSQPRSLSVSPRTAWRRATRKVRSSSV